MPPISPRLKIDLILSKNNNQKHGLLLRQKEGRRWKAKHALYVASILLRVYVGRSRGIFL